jgi:hypothetical protein
MLHSFVEHHSFSLQCGENRCEPKAGELQTQPWSIDETLILLKNAGKNKLSQNRLKI